MANDAIPRYDAWVLARLCQTCPFTGELAAMSSRWEPVARNLDACPWLAGRPSWQASCLARPTRIARKAIADADPKGPAPPVG